MIVRVGVWRSRLDVFALAPHGVYPYASGCARSHSVRQAQERALDKTKTPPARARNTRVRGRSLVLGVIVSRVACGAGAWVQVSSVGRVCALPHGHGIGILMIIA